MTEAEALQRIVSSAEKLRAASPIGPYRALAEGHLFKALDDYYEIEARLDSKKRLEALARMGFPVFGIPPEAPPPPEPPEPFHPPPHC